MTAQELSRPRTAQDRIRSIVGIMQAKGYPSASAVLSIRPTQICVMLISEGRKGDHPFGGETMTHFAYDYNGDESAALDRAEEAALGMRESLAKAYASEFER